MTRHLLEADTSATGLEPGLVELPVQRRYRHDPTKAAGHPQPLVNDHVVVETPVALVFNGLSHVVMMATPTELRALALGFALSEGILPTPDACLDLEVVYRPQGIEVQLQISTRAFEALKGRRRSMEGRTGCGLCGIESLEALADQARPGSNEVSQRPVPPQAFINLDPAAVLRAFEQLPERQVLNQRSGGCHAAGWATPEGTLRLVQEDVGRHNALDKLIGQMAAQGLLGTPGVVILSSRASFELVRKCARVGITALATISAPTSLAVQQARAHGLELVGFCRSDSLVRYTGL